MAVAKSYENMEIVGEPFERDGKMYVRVSGPCKRCGGSGNYSYNPKDGTTCYRCGGSGKENMEVRWYTDKERAAQDRAAEKRAEKKKIEAEKRAVRFKARNAFGFGEAGYITLVIGEHDTIQSWRDELPEHTVWYNEIFHWFIPSDRTPAKIPSNLKAIKLDWDSIKIDDLEMRPRKEVEEYVSSLIYEPSKSTYQGEVGTWLIKDVVIKSNIELDSRFGLSHMHVMEDEDGNVYVWTTASKNIAAGTALHMKMKVKEHKEYKGTQQTIVFYCKEI